MSTITDLMLRSPDGVFAVSAEQTVLFWNRACEDITGTPAAEAVGSRCHEVLKGLDTHGKPLCKVNCPVCSLSNGGLPASLLPMRITHQDGQKIQLCVGTMLMPSISQKQWTVVHVMRRSRDSRTADLFNYDDLPDAAPLEPDGGRLAQLTSRERDVLHLLAEGCSAAIISATLHISATTVRNHIQRLMSKLNVHSRHEAVAFAHRHHLVGSSA